MIICRNGILAWLNKLRKLQIAVNSNTHLLKMVNMYIDLVFFLRICGTDSIHLKGDTRILTHNDEWFSRT